MAHELGALRSLQEAHLAARMTSVEEGLAACAASQVRAVSLHHTRVATRLNLLHLEVVVSPLQLILSIISLSMGLGVERVVYARINQ